jgi:hypothetical protein
MMAKKSTTSKKETATMSDDFIPMDGYGNVQEAGLIETEDEYPLIIKSAERLTHDNGIDYIKVIVEVQGQENAIKGIFVNLWLPMPGDDAEKKKFKMLMIRRFCGPLAFDIPGDGGVNPNDFIGAQADLHVVKSFYKSKKTGQEVPQNEIIIPALAQE